MDKYIEKLKNIRDNQDGFSLIELVVAVGILLVLTVGGVVAYSKITDNARKAAVEAAAAEVYTGAVAYDSNGEDYTQLDDEWMKSSNGSITVEFKDEKETNGEICVVATMTEHTGITASKGPGCDNTGGPTKPDTDGKVEETMKYRVKFKIQAWMITDHDSEFDSVQVRFPLTDDVFTVPTDNGEIFELNTTFDIPGSSGITEEQLASYGDDMDTSFALYEEALSFYADERTTVPGHLTCDRSDDLDTTEGSTEIKAFSCEIQSW